MAINLRGRNRGAIAEINVTPMADVMIVLLIIFMMTASIIIGPAVRLPAASNIVTAEENPLIIVVKADRKVRIGATELDEWTPVESAVRSWLEQSVVRQGEVLLQADESVPHARVMEVMQACRQAGVERIGLQTTRKIVSAL
jgi:biopolymer transport protein TolR